MSAWMVDKVHIDLLVQVAVEGPHGPVTPAAAWHPFRYYAVPSRMLRVLSLDQVKEFSRHVSLDGAEALGQMLAAQNAASVRHRYEDADGRGMIPSWADAFYEYTPIPPLDPPPTVVELLKVIDCYEYQACETPGWPDTEAFQFCETLRARLTSLLPGYDAAPWGWEPEEISKRR
mgnify:CR=1 FL=1